MNGVEQATLHGNTANRTPRICVHYEQYNLLRTYCLEKTYRKLMTSSIALITNICTTPKGVDLPL